MSSIEVNRFCTFYFKKIQNFSTEQRGGGRDKKVDPPSTIFTKLVNRNAIKLSNGHSPQICQIGKLLMQMCGGESHFSQKWRMLNVSKCIESGETGWRMSGECIESGQSRAANVGASKIGHFIYKKRYFYV